MLELKGRCLGQERVKNCNVEKRAITLLIINYLVTTRKMAISKVPC